MLYVWWCCLPSLLCTCQNRLLEAERKNSGETQSTPVAPLWSLLANVGVERQTGEEERLTGTLHRNWLKKKKKKKKKKRIPETVRCHKFSPWIICNRNGPLVLTDSVDLGRWIPPEFSKRLWQRGQQGLGFGWDTVLSPMCWLGGNSVHRSQPLWRL